MQLGTGWFCVYIRCASDLGIESTAFYSWAPFYQARVKIDPKIDSNFDPLKINYNF